MNISPLHAWIAAKIGLAPAELTHHHVEAYQWQKVQQTLLMAREHSPFYRRHLADAPTELTGLADLARLPFTTAADLRRYERQLLCVSQSEIERVVTLPTSGTTGAPKRLYFTGADVELTRDFFHVGMSTFTNPGDRVLTLLPGDRVGSVGCLLSEALPRLGAVNVQHRAEMTVADTLALLRREEISGVVGAPAQVLALARHPHGAGLTPKSCLLVSDYVSTAIRQAIEQAWPCRTYAHYGMTEMGLGGGVECEARRGYHLREADLLVEIIDPQTLEPVAPGLPGEVVFTTLTRRGMPLIRYRTGDLSRFIPGDCPCGAALLTLGRIEGRVDGGVALPNGHRLDMPQLDEALFPLAGLLNFTARLSATGLEIAATVLPGAEANVAAALRPALENIPALPGVPLLLTAQAAPEAAALVSPAKRTIKRDEF